MKNRVLLFVICLVMALSLAVTASFAISADTESTDTSETSSETSAEPSDTEEEPEPSKYTLEFLRGDKLPVEMPLTGDERTCTIELEGNTAYPFVIKNEGAVMDAKQYMLYKNTAGSVTFSYKLAGLTVTGGEGDVFGEYEYPATPFYITLKGAVFTDLTGNFKDKDISAFCFKAGDDISLKAVVEDGMRFKEWKVNDTAIKLGEEETASFTLSNKSVKTITIEAVCEPTLEKLLFESNNVVLKADYTVEKTIKLTSGEYTINLGGHKIESEKTIFEVDGATLKIEGEGEMTSTDTLSSCINVSKGAVEITGGKLSGGYSAISAGESDGETVRVSIKGGEFISGRFGALNLINAETVITGGIFNVSDKEESSYLIGAMDGTVSISGGTFNADNTFKNWKPEEDNIKVVSGDFSSDVSDYVIAGSAVKNENGRYIVVTDGNSYQLEVTGGKGSGFYKVGETVTVTLDKTGKTTEFKGWVVVSGELTITDATAESFSFRMPAGDLKLNAEFEEETVTEPADTTPETTPVTTPVGNVGTDDTTDGGNRGGGSKSILPIILIIILVVLIIAILAVLVIMLLRKKAAEIEEQERAQLSSDVMDSLADKLAGLGLGGAAAGAEKPQNTPVRPRPVRRRPTANFEPEDLTVTAGRPAVAEDLSATRVQPAVTDAAQTAAADDLAMTKELEVTNKDGE